MKEGFLIGGGLVIAGLLLELSVGPVVWEALSWPFVLIYVNIAVILGVVILRRLTHLSNWKRDVPFLLNHLGLFLALQLPLVMLICNVCVSPYGW